MFYRFPFGMLIFPLLVVGLLYGCDDNSAATPPSAESTASSEDAVEESTQAPALANEATALPTEEVTESAAVTEVPSANDNYFMAISYTIDAATAPEDTPPPPENKQWVIIVASLGSQGGDAVEVSVDDLTLIDTAGTRYSAEAPDSATEPPLIGATVEKDISLFGLVRFAIPSEATPAFLEWCPGSDCDNRLQTPFP